MAEYPLEIAPLPITPFLDQVADLLSGPDHALVLTAETGAGKSTAVPLALLQHFPGKIVMLEPRRIAALAVASRVAALLGEECGQTSGYRMHLETCVSARTRFEVLTEAVLVRMLQADPSLEGVSVVVLDEFHERSVHSDTALAFLKEVAALRDDLHILVMSATMEAEKTAAYLGCGVFHVPGRLFPVDIVHVSEPSGGAAAGSGLNQPVRDDIALKAARAVLDELGRPSSVDGAGRGVGGAASAGGSGRADRVGEAGGTGRADGVDGAGGTGRAGGVDGAGGADQADRVDGAGGAARAGGVDGAGGAVDGDILVFLPGLAELRRAYDFIQQNLPPSSDAQVFILHSSTPFAEQKKILRGRSSVEHDGNGGRRVILASSIAETSITVPGVTTVIDSGLSRESRFSPATGMNRLVTVTESEFSAAQRAGRAGRVAPGRCIRLWSRSDARVAVAPPEILVTDLTPVVLECSLWGARSIDALEWLDRPGAAAWQSAVTLLQSLGCIDAECGITEKGRAVVSLGVHPRIGCVALSGTAGCLDYACRYGAAVSRGMSPAAAKAEEGRLRSVLEKRIQSAAQKGAASLSAARTADGAGSRGKPDATGVLSLLAGFPDRLSHHCGGGIYQFPSGRKASLPREVLARTNDAALPEWIIAPDADAGEREGRIWRFEPASGTAALDAALADWLSAHQTIRVEAEFAGGAGGQKLKKTEYTCLGEIILKERRLQADASDSRAAWETLVRRQGIGALPWNEACDAFLVRWRFRVQHGGAVTGCMVAGDSCMATMPADTPSAATVPADALLSGLTAHPEEWLTPFLPMDGRLSADTVLQALRHALDGTAVDRDVPLKLRLENGRERRLSYEVLDKAEGPVPVLEVIIQQMFGCTVTPTVMGVPVLLRLLSPARRPLQVTRDLAGFWKNTWPEVCKEMKGRYPKHNWDHTRFVED